MNELTTEESPDLLDARDPDGKKLFTNAMSLARAVAAVDADDAYKDVASVASSVSKALKRERNCPAALVELIVEAVRQRLVAFGPEAMDAAGHRFRQALSERTDAESSLPKCKRIDFASLLRDARKAKALVAIVPDGISGDAGGRQVMQIMAERLGVGERGLSATDGSTYSLFFPDEARALDFWKDLLLYVASRAAKWHSGIEQVKDHLAKLNSDGHLKVASIPAHVCGIPALIFNVDDETNATGFNLYSFGDGTPALCPMPPDAVNRWRRFVYLPLKLQQIESIDVPFSIS